MKKPSLRIHFRRICSDSDSVSPMPSADHPSHPLASCVRRRRRRSSAQARRSLPGHLHLSNGSPGNRPKTPGDLRSCAPPALPRFGPRFRCWLGCWGSDEDQEETQAQGAGGPGLADQVSDAALRRPGGPGQLEM